MVQTTVRRPIVRLDRYHRPGSSLSEIYGPIIPYSSSDVVAAAVAGVPIDVYSQRDAHHPWKSPFGSN